MSQCRIGLLREWYTRRGGRRLNDRAVIDICQDTVHFVIEYTPQAERVTLRLISMSTAKMRLGTVCEATLRRSRRKVTCSLSDSCPRARDIRTHLEEEQTV